MSDEQLPKNQAAKDSSVPRDEEAILPCPFCGGTKIVKCDDDGLFWKRCTSCGATGPETTKYSGEEGDAFTDWNTRASVPTTSGGAGEKARTYSGDLWIDDDGSANFKFHIEGGDFTAARHALQKFISCLQNRLDRGVECPYSERVLNRCKVCAKEFSYSYESDICPTCFASQNQESGNEDKIPATATSESAPPRAVASPDLSEVCPDCGAESCCKEISRWQEAIRNRLIELGAPDSLIDGGGGCDSGDPLDLTLTEINQAFNYFDENRGT